MAPKSDLNDVIVIGGGPAGTSVATFLTQKGYRVRLFEREKFPREHVGESLLPFCFNLFGELGVLDQMKQRFVRKPGVRFVSGDGSYITTWCFNRVIDNESQLSFQVARAEFDQMLLENSRRVGVDVSEETRVEEVDLEASDGPLPEVRVRTVGADGTRGEHRARFLVDASGRSTFIGTKMRGRHPNPDLDRTALWSHYGDVNLKGGLQEGLSLIVYLGGDKKGWCWVFPLGVDRITVGFVSDNAYIRAQKKELEPKAGAEWKMALLEQELHRSPFIHEILDGAQRTKPLYVDGDYSYTVEKKYGANFALIGDAGRFIDPIFSSGVYLAIKSANLVAGAVDRILGSSDLSGAPLEGAYKQINGAYAFVHRMIKLFYNPHSLTWAEAGRAATGGESAQGFGDAMAAGHYMLAGDFFERQEEYNSMFELLEKPTGFQKFKKLVIDRPDFQETTCNTIRKEIFPEVASGERV